MKEQTRIGIVVGIMAVCTLLIYDVMVSEISRGSLSDILIRRCLFVFVCTFVVATVDRYYKPQLPTFGPFKYAWFGGLFIAAIIELGGVWKIRGYSRTTQTASEVYGKWLAQWWIILIALSLGALGGYLGNKLVRKWCIRREKKSSISEGEY